MLQQGQILQNRYEIISLLGQGGMSCVYKVHDRRLNRVCVLKELVPDPTADASALQ
jgi:serine/threonine protein kinase